MLKVCKTCQQPKELSEFKDHTLYKDGKHWRCISCQNIKSVDRQKKHNQLTKIRYQQNKPKYQEYHKERYISKKQEIRSKQKIYENQNKDKIHAAYLRRTEGIYATRRGENYGPYHTRSCPHCNTSKSILEFNRYNNYTSFGFDYICRECKKIKAKLRYQEKHEEIKEYYKIYRDSHPEIYRESHKKYRESEDGKMKIKEYKSKINFKLGSALSTRVRTALKQFNIAKINSSIIYLGCDIEFFINYLISKFEPGMSMDNYGFGKNKWNIDHKIPIKFFDLRFEEDKHKCFHYTNLQPKWQPDNISKSDKLPDGSRARDINFSDINIFINKSIWVNFNQERMKLFVDSVFNYYRDNGFPYFNLSEKDKNEIFINLMKFESSTLLKTNEILSQNMLGLNLANYYMPHIWEIRNGNYDTPMEVFLDDNKFRKAVEKRIELGDNISDAGIRKAVSIFSGSHRVSNFRPTVAKYIYDNYSGDGHVLDFSAGFGGRLLGAFASDKVVSYRAYEPNSETFNCLRNMQTDIKTSKTSDIIHKPFEDSDCQPTFYDLIFSSPPYFNTEKYSNEETQSYLRYPTKEQWYSGFLMPLIEKSYNYLKYNSYFIVNIANVKNYPELEEDTKKLAMNTGFVLEKIYRMQLSGLMKGEVKYEPIFVFKKR